MSKIPFGKADILLPKKDFEKWAVVACDQYTSQVEYWERADEIVGSSPSALRIILPEVYLEKGDIDSRIESINQTMSEYLDGDIFDEYPDSMVYIERTLADGRVRRGIVGAVDLEGYDYNKGSRSMIRATEGTVLSRIPPRVRIRKDAPLELPHIMILIDDPDDTIIPKTADGKLLYDFELMLGGGGLKGYLLSDKQADGVIEGLESKIAGKSEPLLFAMGDGNHSLATAKACINPEIPASRYALAEIVNIHDPSLDFEPIYRVVFGIDPADMIRAAKAHFAHCNEKRVKCIFSGGEEELFADGLTAGVLQEFIDEYITGREGAYVDYIHGEDTVKALCKEQDTLGFIFDGISKSELFDYVEKNGALPRKTFSMGEAHDKRYYMECRRIK